MDYRYIEQLLERYWRCETTLQEEEILRTFVSQDDIPAGLERYKALFRYEKTEPQTDVLGADFDARMMARIESQRTVKARVIRMPQRLRPLFKAAAVVVKGLHSQRDFLVRFADHRVKRQLHAGILAIAAEPQCRIKRFGYKRRSGNRSVIRSFAVFGYRFKKARLSRI